MSDEDLHLVGRELAAGDAAPELLLERSALLLCFGDPGDERPDLIGELQAFLSMRRSTLRIFFDVGFAGGVLGVGLAGSGEHGAGLVDAVVGEDVRHPPVERGTIASSLT